MPNSESQGSPSGWPTRVVLFGLAVLIVLPILSAHHLLLLDGPAHESRLAILHDLLGSRHGSPFYNFDTLFLPNVAFDIIGFSLTYFVSPETAGRIFFALTLALTVSGVAVLNRAVIGRWSFVPLASALLLYNLVSSLGFFSYAFGLALIPWILAARIRLERASPFLSLPLGAAFGILLLFCHAFDFAIYTVMVAGFGLVAVLESRISIRRAFLWALEAVPASLLFLFMSTGTGSHARYEPNFLFAKLLGLAKSVTSGSMIGDAAFAIGAATFVLLLTLCSRARLARSFVPGLIVLGVLYFVLPAKLASGSYVDSRMPVAIMLLLLAGLEVQIQRSNTSLILVAVFGLALTVKQGAIAILWNSFDRQVGVIVRTFDALPNGSVILQAECQPDAHDILGVYRERQPSMSRLAAMAAFEDTRFVAVNYAIAGQQPIRVALAYQPYLRPQGSFDERTCSPTDYHNGLVVIEKFARNQKTAGHAIPPIYFFLIRPPAPMMLATEATLIARSADTELYAVRPRGATVRGGL